ncbi:MAG TPA: hypothetical protein VN943_00475 [Candidatus Acidoferrum sp.]|nr:hypothetical protein [Candidatus Acidoferrum sp.]
MKKPTKSQRNHRPAIDAEAARELLGGHGTEETDDADEETNARIHMHVQMAIIDGEHSTELAELHTTIAAIEHGNDAELIAAYKAAAAAGLEEFHTSDDETEAARQETVLRTYLDARRRRNYIMAQLETEARRTIEAQQ